MIEIGIKQTTIDSSKLKVPFNYVLIKMDENYTTYQMKGKETGILQHHIVYDKGKVIRADEKIVNHFGTVIKVPERLIFNGHEMAALNKEYQPIREFGEPDEFGARQKRIVHPDILRKIGNLKKNSVDYETSIELNEGDRVFVSYIHLLQAEKHGLYIYNTDIGDLVMVKYDLLRMVVDEHKKPIKMLNGLILIKPKKYTDDIKHDRGYSYIERDSGIALINPSETKSKRANQVGEVVLCGTPISGYLNYYELVDDDIMYSYGDNILYDPRLAIKLENDLHQIIYEEDLYLIRREAIIADKNMITDFDKIII